MKFGVGQPVPSVRRRQACHRTRPFPGRHRGCPRQVYAVFLRSPHAHAAYPFDRYRGGRGRARCARRLYRRRLQRRWPRACRRRRCRAKSADGSPMFAPQRPALVIDRVRYVGDPVAMVIAETLAQAKDAAELVAVDYEALPSVTRYGGGGPARRAARVGRKSRTTSRIPSARQQGQRPTPPSRMPRMSCGALRYHAGACPIHGAARRDRHLRCRR